MNKNFIDNLIFLLAGITAVFFRDSFSRHIIKFQNTVWGFNFGEREIKASRFLVLVVGIGFVVMSLLSLTGVIHVR